MNPKASPLMAFHHREQYIQLTSTFPVHQLIILQSKPTSIPSFESIWCSFEKISLYTGCSITSWRWHKVSACHISMSILHLFLQFSALSSHFYNLEQTRKQWYRMLLNDHPTANSIKKNIFFAHNCTTQVTNFLLYKFGWLMFLSF